MNKKTIKKNIEWFNNDLTRKNLKKLAITKGKVRGLNKFKMTFEYPITVIAGENGSGKTTILALAACGYHNFKDGFKLKDRKNTYYTFSDFFVQTKDEIPNDGIEIGYAFLHNRWRRSDPGIGHQYRRKSKGGRWNNYEQRIKRDVVYFGISRVVPHTERSVYKTYKSKFIYVEEKDITKKICEYMNYIFNKDYENVFFKEHSKYRLPYLVVRGDVYSGFNMGAGEMAVLDMISTIYSAPDGLLVLVDEIELGLHRSAQIKLMEVLNKLIMEKKIQIIATTHSATILEAVPHQGRYYIENSDSEETKIVNGISWKYAYGKLKDVNSEEIDLLCEDGLAETILRNSIKYSFRKRMNIISIGSDSAIIKQMAAHYKNSHDREYIAVFDGDKRTSLKSATKKFLDCLESYDIEKKGELREWFTSRVMYIPSSLPPEKWIVKEVLDNCLNESKDFYMCTHEEMKSFLEKALRGSTHSEFYSLSESLSIPADEIQTNLTRMVIKNNADFVDEVNGKINELI